MWFAVRSAARLTRRNACALILIAFLSPWAFFLWQLQTHFGALYASPLRLLQRESSVRPNISAPQVAHPVLLVTAYFPLSRSRHSIQEYRGQMSNLLSRVTTDLYVFTTPDMESTIRELRGRLPIYINSTFGTVRDIPIVGQLSHDYPAQYARGRETQRFSLELHMLRTAKPWLLSEGLRNVGAVGEARTGNHSRTDYRYAFWMDAGGLPDKTVISDWPSVDRLDQVWTSAATSANRTTEELFFVPVNRQPSSKQFKWRPSEGPMQESSEFSQGSFFGGPLGAVSWFNSEFYKNFRHFLASGHSVSSERSIISAILFLHTDRVLTVLNRDPSVQPSSERHGSYGHCGRPWLYYIWWLALESERDEQNVIWSDAGWRWNFWREKNYCRLAKPMLASELLGKTYGSYWRSPSPPVIAGR